MLLMLISGIMLLAAAQTTNAFTVEGKLLFTKPPVIEDNSKIVIKVQDVNIADAPAKVLKTLEKNLAKYEKQFEFKIEDIPEQEKPVKLSISAVIRNGWQEGNDPKEWIRRGDYLSDTQIPIDYNPGVKLYKQDVKVVLYE